MRENPSFQCCWRRKRIVAVHVPEKRCKSMKPRDLLWFFRRFAFYLFAIASSCLWDWKEPLGRCKTYSTLFLLFWWFPTFTGTFPTLSLASPPNRRNNTLPLLFSWVFELLSLPINKRHENAQSHSLTVYLFSSSSSSSQHSPPYTSSSFPLYFHSFKIIIFYYNRYEFIVFYSFKSKLLVLILGNFQKVPIVSWGTCTIHHGQVLTDSDRSRLEKINFVRVLKPYWLHVVVIP